MILLLCVGIPLVSTGWLWLLCHMDGECLPSFSHIPLRLMLALWAGGGVMGVRVAYAVHDGGWDRAAAFGLGAACLAVCGATDILICQVYDLVQLVGILAGAWTVLCQHMAPETGVHLILFTLLQYFVFMRMYGQGDGLVFLLCALFETAGGGSIRTYLLHMAAAYLLMGLVQCARKNITSTGNLKKPVPFVPYIAVTAPLFWP